MLYRPTRVGHRGDREEQVVAKHRQQKNRRASSATQTIQKRRRPPSVILLGTTATALSTVLVFGDATNNTSDTPEVELAAATIGIGGRGDPTAANIQHKLQGKVVPFGDIIAVNYPASFFIDSSVAAGVPTLDQTIKQNSNQFLLVVAYSEGTIVAEKVRRDLDPSDPGAPPLNPDRDPNQPGLLFVMVASPNVPNGGIFARLPDLTIPFFVTSNGPAQPSPYDTTYVTNEYDPYADFPAYFNPLSLANTLVAVAYVHPDQYYDSIDYDPLAGSGEDPGTTPVLVKTVTKSADRTDTYVFVPAEQLPLLAPARQVFGAVGLTPLSEPVLGAIEPLLRLVVDMGYTDRENANPQVHVQFSLITPPERIIETIAAVPGALEQGANNFVTGVESIPGSIHAPSAPTIAPSIKARSLPQQAKDSQLDNNPPPAGAGNPAPPQAPSGSGTSPTETPLSTLSNSGPTLGDVTEDGNKATPNTSASKSRSPKKNVLTQLADTIRGFVSGKKKPGSATPSSEPNDSTPSGSTSQGQTSNAA
jgi:diacyltrehalose acyltransferase